MKNKVHVHVSITSFIHNTTWSDRNVHVYLDVHVMLKLTAKLLNKICFKNELFCHFMNYRILYTCTCITLVSILFFFAESRNRMFTAVVEMLRWFAGHQIRNVAVSACRFKCTFFHDIYYSINY